MKTLPPTPLDAVHMTRPQEPSDDTSVWPALGASGAVVLAVGLTLSRLLVVVGTLVIAAAVWGAAREVYPPGARPAAGPSDESRTGDDFWRRRPKHFWLAAGFIISSASMFAAILRSFVTYDLYQPGNWPAPAQDLNVPLAAVATGLIVASVAAAYVGRRLLYAERRGPGLTLLLLAIAAGAGFVGLMARVWTGLLEGGFLPSESSAGSLYFALAGYHALVTTAGLVLLGILAWYTIDRRLGEKRDAVLQGAVAYWTFVAVAWLVTYGLFHLRLYTGPTPELISD